MAERRFLVYGAGGHGKVVADAGVAAGLHLIGFIDDEATDGGSLNGIPAISWHRITRERVNWEDAAIALAIGDNRVRSAIFDRVRSERFRIGTVVHPAAVVAPSAELGKGTVVMACAVVNPDSVVGAGAILNTGCVVEHDVVLGDFVHLSPNATLGGSVRVGARSHLGLGAVVLPGIRIGDDVVVGAGAVVTRDVPDGQTVVGVPARPIDQRSTTLK